MLCELLVWWLEETGYLVTFGGLEEEWWAEGWGERKDQCELHVYMPGKEAPTLPRVQTGWPGKSRNPIDFLKESLRDHQICWDLRKTGK